MIYFTSDQHFGHENIIKYAQRPFETAYQMDFEMIRRWNERVRPDDIVYHLGDFTLNNRARRYMEQLNGHIHILQYPYHHDGRWLANEFQLFGTGHAVIYEDGILVLEIPAEQLGHEGAWPVPIVLCHYEFASWDRKHYGAWHLFGHDHRKINVSVKNEFKINVGVDAHDFYPVSLAEVHAAMVQRGWYYGWREIKSNQ